MLEPSERGDMIFVKEGRRSMQIAWTHLLPATFGGRAVMNVARTRWPQPRPRSLAGASSARHAGQGLRSFSTNYYLSPGRLNEVSVEGRTVIVDYCHNAPGMKMLGDFVDKTGDQLEVTSEFGRTSRIGVIAHRG